MSHRPHVRPRIVADDVTRSFHPSRRLIRDWPLLAALSGAMALLGSSTGCLAQSCRTDEDCGGGSTCDRGTCAGKRGRTGLALGAQPAGDAMSAGVHGGEETVDPLAGGEHGDAGTDGERAEPPLPTCQAFVEHIHELATTTGSDATKQTFPAVEVLVPICEGKTFHPKTTRCMMAATEYAAIDDCHRRTYAIDAGMKPERRFDGRGDHSAVDPPVFTQDRDFLEFHEGCGVLLRQDYPAGAFFFVCGDMAELGPFVNVDEMNALFRGISDLDESTAARPEYVQALFDAVELNWPTTSPPLGRRK